MRSIVSIRPRLCSSIHKRRRPFGLVFEFVCVEAVIANQSRPEFLGEGASIAEFN